MTNSGDNLYKTETSRKKFCKLEPIEYYSDNSAERLSSAMNALVAERAARSTIRDKRVHSL
jgi:hypothetical protein